MDIAHRRIAVHAANQHMIGGPGGAAGGMGEVGEIDKQQTIGPMAPRDGYQGIDGLQRRQFRLRTNPRHRFSGATIGSGSPPERPRYKAGGRIGDHARPAIRSGKMRATSATNP